MTKTARERLIDYLYTRETATAAEVSRTLKSSTANARHHLAALVADGVVQVVGERSQDRAGRPAQLYALAQPTARHNLDQLAIAALDLLLACTPTDQHSTLPHDLAQQLAGTLPSAHSLTLRLSFAIHRLDQMGYHARWEAHAGGPRLILGHCPYAAILDQRPMLCSMDVALLSTLLGERAILLAKLETSPSGLPHCIFQVGR